MKSKNFTLVMLLVFLALILLAALNAAGVELSGMGGFLGTDTPTLIPTIPPTDTPPPQPIASRSRPSTANFETICPQILPLTSPKT